MKNLIYPYLLILIFTSCKKRTIQLPNPLDVGLVAYYPLDGDAKDYTNFRNHGTINAQKSSDRKNFLDKAYLFDTSYFQSTNIPIGLKKQYTFSFWIRMKSYRDGMAVMELAKPNSNNISEIPCNGNPQLWQINDSLFLTPTSNSPNRMLIFSLQRVKVGIDEGWKHVLWTVNGGLTRMYVNGEFKSEKMMPWPDVENINLTLGNAGNTCLGDNVHSNFHNQPSHVLIDEVRIYNRVLDSTQIRKLSY